MSVMKNFENLSPCSCPRSSSFLPRSLSSVREGDFRLLPFNCFPALSLSGSYPLLALRMRHLLLLLLLPQLLLALPLPRISRRPRSKPSPSPSSPSFKLVRLFPHPSSSFNRSNSYPPLDGTLRLSQQLIFLISTAKQTGDVLIYVGEQRTHSQLLSSSVFDLSSSVWMTVPKHKGATSEHFQLCDFSGYAVAALSTPQGPQQQVSSPSPPLTAHSSSVQVKLEWCRGPNILRTATARISLENAIGPSGKMTFTERTTVDAPTEGKYTGELVKPKDAYRAVSLPVSRSSPD